MQVACDKYLYEGSGSGNENELTFTGHLQEELIVARNFNHQHDLTFSRQGFSQIPDKLFSLILNK